MACITDFPKITAGFSATWRATVPADYPSSAFSLNYVFRNVETGAKQTFSATSESLTGWKLSLTPANTTAIGAGTFTLVGYVTDDATGGTATKEVISTQTVIVHPDPTDAVEEDRRSFYARMVAKLRTALEALASGTLSSVSVNGKSYTNRNLAEVREELGRFQSLLDAEDAAACGNGANRIYLRFGRPQ